MIAGNAGGSAVGENSCSFLNFIALHIKNWLSDPILILTRQIAEIVRFPLKNRKYQLTTKVICNSMETAKRT